MADRPMEPLIEFGTQTCLGALSVLIRFSFSHVVFLMYVFVVALAKQMVV